MEENIVEQQPVEEQVEKPKEVFMSLIDNWYSKKQELKETLNTPIITEEIQDIKDTTYLNIYDHELENLIQLYDLTPEFRDLIQITDRKEATAAKTLITLFIKKKRDYKFIVIPNYNTLLELCKEFIIKVQPIVEYLILRFYEQGNFSYYNRWKLLLESCNAKRISSLYFRLHNSMYSKPIIYKKLNMLLEKERKKLNSLLLLVYALNKLKEKPLRQGTVGITSNEFEELYDQ